MTPCCRGRHPSLATSVTLDVLEREFLEVLSRGPEGLPDRWTVRISDALARTHARNPRRYAQSVPATLTCEFAPQFLLLPRGNRIGLIAHELGHCAAHRTVGPGHSEEDADEEALRTFGVRIDYDPRWPGRGLQRGRLVDRASNPLRRWRLVELRRSSTRGKKWRAVFEDGRGGRRTTHFGAAGYEDFTTHRDLERRARYLERHGRGGEDWSDPTSAGALSRWILWNKPTIEASVRDFRRRFGV